jgi:hypothetical protein
MNSSKSIEKLELKTKEISPEGKLREKKKKDKDRFQKHYDKALASYTYND